VPLPEGYATVRLQGPSPGADDTISAVHPSRNLRLTRAQIRVEHRGQLVMTAPGNDGHVYVVEGNLFTFGRAQDNTLILQDSHVSGHHASIVRDGDHFVVEDNQSSNGIKVGDKKVQRAYLKDGDEIEIYPYRFRFELTFDVMASA
jgi:pSer/pThr/pTyr-binding forkhead associated (FHA) protein